MIFKRKHVTKTNQEENHSRKKVNGFSSTSHICLQILYPE